MFSAPWTFTVSDAMRLVRARGPAHVNQCGCEWPTQRMCDPLSTKDPSVGVHLLQPALPGSCSIETLTIISENRVSPPPFLFFLFFLFLLEADLLTGQI